MIGVVTFVNFWKVSSILEVLRVGIGPDYFLISHNLSILISDRYRWKKNISISLNIANWIIIPVMLMY